MGPSPAKDAPLLRSVDTVQTDAYRQIVVPPENLMYHHMLQAAFRLSRQSRTVQLLTDAVMSATRRKVVPSLLLGLAAVRAVLPVDPVQQLTATLLSHCLINPIVLIELRLAQFDQHTFWTKRRCCDFVLDLSDLRIVLV